MLVKEVRMHPSLHHPIPVFIYYSCRYHIIQLSHFLQTLIYVCIILVFLFLYALYVLLRKMYNADLCAWNYGARRKFFFSQQSKKSCDY